jgi:hypothetical protein
VAERQLPKLNVAGSIPVSRSISLKFQELYRASLLFASPPSVPVGSWCCAPTGGRAALQGRVTRRKKLRASAPSRPSRRPGVREQIAAQYHRLAAGAASYSRRQSGSGDTESPRGTTASYLSGYTSPFLITPPANPLLINHIQDFQNRSSTLPIC